MVDDVGVLMPHELRPLQQQIRRAIEGIRRGDATIPLPSVGPIGSIDLVISRDRRSGPLRASWLPAGWPGRLLTGDCARARAGRTDSGMQPGRVPEALRQAEGAEVLLNRLWSTGSVGSALSDASNRGARAAS